MATRAVTSSRNRLLDILRAVATLRVVVYHASGDVRWSWFAAMPVMFFVGGSLYAQSIERRPWQEVLPVRLRRIFVPWTVWIAFAIVVITVAGGWDSTPWWRLLGFSVGVTGSETHLYWTWMALWYLNAYTLFMLIGIPLRRAHRRAPRLTVALVFLPSLVSGLLREPSVGATTANLAFWVLGYSFFDGSLKVNSRTRGFVLGVTLAGLGVAYAVAFTGLSVLVTEIPILSALVGVGWIAVALAARPELEGTLRFRPVALSVEWLKQRALTVYLWHALAVGIVDEVAMRWDLGGAEMTIRVLAVLALTFLLTILLGWVEDIAAKRPPRLWPDLSGAATARPVAIPAPAPGVDLTGPVTPIVLTDGVAPSVPPNVPFVERRAAGG